MELPSQLQKTAGAIVRAERNGTQGVYHMAWQKFMEQLGRGSVDLMLTDPPYTISRDTGFSQIGKNSVARFGVSMDFGEWDHEQINLLEFCKQAYRVLRQGGTAIVWYDLWKLTELETAMRDAGFKMIRLIIWQKTNPVPLNQSATYLSNSREVAVVGVKGGKPVFNGKYDNGVYSLPIPRHKGKREHPTQKPLDLFSELVSKHSNAGDFVIDPFLGSGTTGVASVSQGRDFEGSEIDSNYVKISRRRIAQALCCSRSCLLK